MKKRILSIILTLCLIMSLLPIVAVANSNVAISTTKTEVKVGDTFDVSLTVPGINEEKAATASFMYYFDNTAFEVVNFSAPSIGGTSAKASNSSTDSISCTYEGTNGENTIDITNGTVVNATFRVREGANGGSQYFTVDAEQTYVEKLEDDGYTSTVLIAASNGLKTTVTVVGDSLDENSTSYTTTITNQSNDLAGVGDTVKLDVNVNNVFNSAKVVLAYDTNYLTYVSGECAQAMGTGDEEVSITGAGGVVTIIDYGTAFDGNEAAYTLTFTAKAATAGTNVTFTSAGFSTAEEALEEDLTDAATKTPVSVPIGYSVTVPNEFEASADTVVPGGSVTITGGSPYYDYVLEATGGTINKNGNSWTVSDVTGNVKVTVKTKTAKSYSVTWDGTGAADINNKPATLPYGTDFTVTLPADKAAGLEAGYTYSISAKRGETSIGSYDSETRVFTIPGTEITDAITITVNKETIEANQVTITISGDAGVAVKNQAGTSVNVAKGSEVTLVLTKEAGYTYTVTLDGNPISFDSNNEYTFTANSNVTVNVTKKLDTTGVQAELYLEYDADSNNGNDLYLVYIDSAKIAGKIYKFGDQPFYYSTEYGAYCVLVDATTPEAAASAVAANLSLVDGEVVGITYNGDVNKTTNVDVNDAQLVWNMYSAKYNSFTQNVTLEKFLKADVNGDKEVNTTDASAIINSVLGKPNN